MLADEPTASLDKKSGRDVVELIQDLAREDGSAVILVTHDNRILDVADRILHLEDGHMKSLSEVVSEGTSRMLNLLEKHDPNRPITWPHFPSRWLESPTPMAKSAIASGMKCDAYCTEVAKLEPAEVEFIMEMSMMQKRAKSGIDNQIKNPRSTMNAPKHFLESLYAIAQADGKATSEELIEIEAIAAEFGLTKNGASV